MSSTKEKEKPNPSFNYDLEIFKLCQKYIKEKNHHGLALIARQKGLPPFLRYRIWPILLKYHPYVINPSIQPDIKKSDIDSPILNNGNENGNGSSSISSNSSRSTSNGSSNSSSNSNSNSNSNLKPNSSDSSNSKSNNNDELNTEELLKNIDKDLKKYLIRLKYSQQIKNLSKEELEFFDILKDSILKFLIKWRKIIKYDSAFTWIALGLAEWFPPIPNTDWVLVGRDIPKHKSGTPPSSASSTLSNLNSDSSDREQSQPQLQLPQSQPQARYSQVLEIDDDEGKEPLIIKDLFSDYSNYMDNLNLNLNSSEEDLSDSTSADAYFKNTNQTMKFHEVFERLVLVLLHCPQNKLRQDKDFKKIDNYNNEKFLNLPKNGGSIEERVTFFIYLLRKLLPELSKYFSEEQILNKFGSNDDEWLIWWLKYCGSKVWSRVDRGKIWDILIGFKFKSKGKNYNESNLHLSDNLLSKFSNDNFWCFDYFQNDSNDINDSLKLTDSSSSLINLNDLTISQHDDNDIPFPKVNPHIQLIFISLALLKSKQHVLLELDQHEIRQYLSRLPTNSYNLSNKYHIFKQKIDKKREEQKIKDGQLQPQSQSQSQSQSQINSNGTKNSRSSTISDLSDYKSLPNSPISHTSTSTSLSFSTSPTDQIISNDSLNNHSIDLMDNIINEAGELWRKWLQIESETR